MRRPSASPQLSEEFLRRIWQDRLFTTSGLKTADGRSVAILSPGTPNLDGGPDFRDAAIRIGSITYRGDVELHVDARSWESHRHHSDPHYNSVILHVVLAADELLRSSFTVSRRPLPLLILHPYLDPATERTWAETYHDEASAQRRKLPCSRHNGALPAGVIEQWLQNLSAERLEFKIRRMHERLKQLVDESRGTLREPYPRFYGNPNDIPNTHPGFTTRDFSPRFHWEQLLYEGLMEGMGYSKNRAPFLTLARSIRIARLRELGPVSMQTIMAVLFGAAGLLPPARRIKEKDSRIYLRPLRKRWRELRPRLHTPLLHEGDWLFFRLRPVNFPTARLAAFCYLVPTLFREGALRELIAKVKQPGHPRETLAAIRTLFAFQPDFFWQHHCHFAGATARTGIALGRDRVDALIVNTIIPLILLYARLFRDAAIREQALLVADTIPPSSRNAITVTMEDQLLRGRLPLRHAAAQQGIIQLYQEYCSVNRCAECDLGKRLAAGVSLA